MAKGEKIVLAATGDVNAPAADNAPNRRHRRSRWPKFLSRNPRVVAGATLLAVILTVVLLADLIAPYPPDQADVFSILAGSSADHWLGTDEVGRDVLSRLMHGGRVSLTIGILATAMTIVIGTFAGLISGYFGGFWENVVMRATDAVMAVPLYFLWVTILSLFGSSFFNLVMVLSLTMWMRVGRIVRGDVLNLKSREFIEAARALGVRETRIILWHILPNVVPTIVVAATFGIAQTIMAAAALSFLGFGVQPPTASWGNMLTGAQTYIWTDPILVISAGLCIFVTVIAFSLLGEGLREALDPRRR